MARDIVFNKNLGTTPKGSKKSVTDAQAKFLVLHGIADYVEAPVQKNLTAAKPKKPKKTPKAKNTYETKVLTAKD